MQCKKEVIYIHCQNNWLRMLCLYKIRMKWFLKWRSMTHLLLRGNPARSNETHFIRGNCCLTMAKCLFLSVWHCRWTTGGRDKLTASCPFTLFLFPFFFLSPFSLIITFHPSVLVLCFLLIPLSIILPFCHLWLFFMSERALWHTLTHGWPDVTQPSQA